MIKSIKELKETLSKSLGHNNINFALFDSTSFVHMTAEDFYQQYNPEELQKGQCNIVGKIESEHDAIAQFSVKDMQGCAGILIAYDLYVMPKFRKKGIGTAIFDFIKSFANHYGYAIVQATDLESNKEAKSLFVKKGWNEIEKFVNPKTKNEIVIWILNT